MVKKKGGYHIPFDKNGNQLHYPDPSYDFSSGSRVQVGPIWKNNDPFSDTLTFESYSRGRSAAYFRFRRSDNTQVCMFLSDMTDAIPHMVNGKLTGNFQFTKRGMNYGVQLQKP
jgi:hypothetical protein